MDNEWLTILLFENLKFCQIWLHLDHKQQGAHSRCITWVSWHLKSLTTWLFIQQLVQGLHQSSALLSPFWGESISDSQRVIKAESVSILNVLMASSKDYYKFFLRTQHLQLRTHTAHTIVSWSNPKYWQMIHILDLMIIIRWSTNILTIKREMGKLKAHNSISMA